MPRNWALQPPQYIKTRKDQVLITSLNVRSARANNKEILDYLHLVQPHCLCIQETWGYSTNCQGYKFIANHRPTRGGGVSIVYKNSLKLKATERLMTKDIEAIVATNDKLIIMNIYRPPKGDISEFSRLLKETLMQYKSGNKTVLIAGDFNTDFMKDTRQSQLITDSCLDINLILPHKVPSRVTDNTSSQIDAIFCNVKNIELTGTFSTLFSDHYNPFAIVNNGRLANRPEFITFRNTKPENIKAVNQDLLATKWDLEDLTVNEAYDSLISTIKTVYDRHCPNKKRKVDIDKMGLQSFMTKGLLVSRITKNKMIANYVRKRTPEKRDKLREYVKIFKKVCRASDLMDTESFLKTNSNNSRKIWQMAKGKLGLSKLQDSITNEMFNEDKVLLTNDNDIADNLNKFFVNIGSDLTKSIPRSDKFKRYL